MPQYASTQQSASASYTPSQPKGFYSEDGPDTAESSTASANRQRQQHHHHHHHHAPMPTPQSKYTSAPVHTNYQARGQAYNAHAGPANALIGITTGTLPSNTVVDPARKVVIHQSYGPPPPVSNTVPLARREGRTVPTVSDNFDMISKEKDVKIEMINPNRAGDWKSSNGHFSRDLGHYRLSDQMPRKEGESNGQGPRTIEHLGPPPLMTTSFASDNPTSQSPIPTQAGSLFASKTHNRPDDAKIKSPIIETGFSKPSMQVQDYARFGQSGIGLPEYGNSFNQAKKNEDPHQQSMEKVSAEGKDIARSGGAISVNKDSSSF